MYENQTELVSEKSQPVEAGELSKLSLFLNGQAQRFNSLLYELYKGVELIKPFPPQDQKSEEVESQRTGLVDEFYMTGDWLKQNNRFLEHIIKHFESVV